MERHYTDAEARFLLADELIERGEIINAKELLLEIINDEPDYGKAHSYLGWIYGVKLSDYNLAERHLRIAMKYAPNYPGGYLNYGYLLLDLDRVDELLEHTKQALRIEGIDRASVYRQAGLASEIKGNYLDAYKFFIASKKQGMNLDWLNLIKQDIKRLKKKMDTIDKTKVVLSRSKKCIF